MLEVFSVDQISDGIISHIIRAYFYYYCQYNFDHKHLYDIIIIILVVVGIHLLIYQVKITSDKYSPLYSD